MSDSRSQTQKLIGRVHERELVFEFFFVFSRFEHALLRAGYFQTNCRDARPDWDRFAKEHDEAFSVDSSEQVQDAVQYYEACPPKKLVIDSGAVTVSENIPEEREQLARLLILVRRTRNNLFHGEKFRGLLEGFDLQRDVHLLEHGLTILYACLLLSSDVCDKVLCRRKVGNSELGSSDLTRLEGYLLKHERNLRQD